MGGVVTVLSDKAMDNLFLLRGSVQPDQEIIIVGVDEESLAALGAWPFPRRLHAELLGRLSKAKVIGFDFLFSEATDQDQVMKAALQSSPPVVLASARSYQHQIINPTPLLAKSSTTGHIEIILGRDGVVRKTNAVINEDQRPLPAFALSMLQGAGLKTDLTSSDNPLLINYYGPENTFLYLSYIDVLRGDIQADFFKDRFILVGAQALGIGDSHITPFSINRPTPGVEIQATIINNLIDNSYFRQLTLFSWMSLGTIALLCFFVWPWMNEKSNLFINLALVLLFTTISYGLFRLHIFLNPVPFIIFLTLTFLAHLAIERIWTARELLHELKRLDRQLATQLQQVYTNIPSRFFNLETIPSKSGIRQHISQLHASVNVMGLQHHFIENLLREELPPLILWDKSSGLVIIANTMFHTFWNKHFSEQSALPDLAHFLHLIEENHAQGEQTRFDFNTLLEGGQTSPIDIGMTLLGRTRYYRVNMNPVKVANIEFNGVLAVVTDVTEIKELERLKDEIVSIVSHELKLPLTAILGYGEILTDSLQNSQKEYAEEICSQAMRLNRLIEDFLDITRLEHGSRQLKRFPLSLVRLVSEGTKAVSISAEKKSINLKQETPYQTTPLIGDHNLLLQALINLLDNAIKFSPENTQVTTSLVEETEQFVICVSDQGPGIPAHSHNEIFNKFNRGLEIPEQDGFGLGLSFVKQVVEKHGGTINLIFDTESGAKFCITLPKNQES